MKNVINEVKLLIVNEEDDFSDLLKKHIELNQYQGRIIFKQVCSQDDAVELLKNWQPSVVMIDAYLPDVNSLDLVERWQGGTAQLIVTSDNKHKNLEVEALRKGASAVVIKSYDIDSINETIQQINDLAQIAPILQ